MVHAAAEFCREVIVIHGLESFSDSTGGAVCRVVLANNVAFRLFGQIILRFRLHR